MASLLFTPSEDGDANLRREGIDPDKIVRVGNVMIDTLMRRLEDSGRSRVLDDLDLRPGGYAALTMDDPETPRVIHQKRSPAGWSTTRLTLRSPEFCAWPEAAAPTPLPSGP